MIVFRHGLSALNLTCRSNVFRPNIVSQVRYCVDVRKMNLTDSKNLYTFDTNRLMKNLQDAGLTSKQAEVITYALVEIIQEERDFAKKNLVTNTQQEIEVQRVISLIDMIRKDMQILEKSEFSNLKHEYEKQNIEIQQLKEQFKKEMDQKMSQMKLNLNLAVDNVKDDYVKGSQEIAGLKSEISIATLGISKDISKLSNELQTEKANLIALMERKRNDTIKYVAGALMTCLTIALGYYRLWLH